MSPVVAPRPLRWLVAAPLSASPSGRKIGVSGERFTAVMAKLSPTATVRVPDRLGGAPSRAFSLSLSKPRDFRTRDVIGNIALLAELGRVADRLANDGNVDAAVTKIRALAGEGRLLDALQGRDAAAVMDAVVDDAPPPPTRAPAAVSAAADDDDDDPIFGKAALASAAPRTQAEAKSAVGSFISAIRKVQSPGPKQVPQGRSAAVLLRQALDATAHDVLSDASVAKLERAWRSLRMVMAACPGVDDLGVDAVDVDTDTLVATLREALSAEGLQRPDAVFVIEPIDDVEVLGALADLADAARVPIVVEVTPDAIGFSPGAETLGESPESWRTLRARASACWLCAMVGTPVLVHETDGPPRTVFGGAAAAMAAMAAASVAQTGTPAGILGRDGALVAPAAHSVPSHGETQTIPTRDFIPYRTQKALVERGVTALGSEADNDRLRLAAAPMVAGEMALPGRILAGRAHRLAVAVREQLGPGATPQALAQALEDASGNFLPKIGPGDVTLRVRDATAAELQVDASIGAVLAGASVTFSSDV